MWTSMNFSIFTRHAYDMCPDIYTVMAIRSIAATKRCIHGIQQATEHSKCRVESKFEQF